jgi:hypothetical protein
MDVMRRVKLAFSPADMFNQGNVFPEEKVPAPA